MLILDDSEDDALLIVHQLQQASYGVNFQRVDTPQFFAAELALEKWDLVLADYFLPYFEGYEALDLWKKSGSKAPLIFVSGMMTPEVAVGAMKEGAHDYINKNNLSLLVPSVERELALAEERRRAHAALATAGEELEKKVKERAERLKEITDALTAAATKHQEIQALIRRYVLCLTLLRDLNEEIDAGLDLDRAVGKILEHLEVVLPETLRTVRLFDDAGAAASAVYGNRSGAQCRDARWQAVDEGLARLVWESKAPVVIGELAQDPRSREPEWLNQEKLLSFLGVPLVARRKTFGVLSFYTRERHEFAEEETQLLSALADQAAAAIDSLRRKS